MVTKKQYIAPKTTVELVEIHTFLESYSKIEEEVRDDGGAIWGDEEDDI